MSVTDVLLFLTHSSLTIRWPQLSRPASPQVGRACVNCPCTIRLWSSCSANTFVFVNSWTFLVLTIYSWSVYNPLNFNKSHVTSVCLDRTWISQFNKPPFRWFHVYITSGWSRGSDRIRRADHTCWSSLGPKAPPGTFRGKEDITSPCLVMCYNLLSIIFDQLLSVRHFCN